MGDKCELYPRVLGVDDGSALRSSSRASKFVYAPSLRGVCRIFSAAESDDRMIDKELVFFP